MKSVFIEAIGIFGSGFEDWPQAQTVLAGAVPYTPIMMPIPVPCVLPPRDRRRCSDTVKLALHVAEQTTGAGAFDLSALPSIFSCSADGQIVHRLLCALSEPGRPVSPTDFHNSVHNAAAGYWSMGTNCHEPSTSIAAEEFSFAAALLKAAAHSLSEDKAALMVCFDRPLPEPLHATYPISGELGVGLIVAPRRSRTALAELEFSWEADRMDSASPPRTEGLEPLWLGNPAGRALPLLELVARRQTAHLSVAASRAAALKVHVICL